MIRHLNPLALTAHTHVRGSLIPLAAGLANLPTWGGFVVDRWRIPRFAAFARLRLPPLEIFPQLELQPALARRRRGTSPVVVLIRHAGPHLFALPPPDFFRGILSATYRTARRSRQSADR